MKAQGENEFRVIHYWTRLIIGFMLRPPYPRGCVYSGTPLSGDSVRLKSSNPVDDKENRCPFGNQTPVIQQIASLLTSFCTSTLTPCSRALTEKLRVAQTVNSHNFPMFTRATHWFPAWAKIIQPTFSHPFYLWPILILSFHLRQPLFLVESFIPIFRPKFSVIFPPFLCAPHAEAILPSVTSSY
jgi:hypothetical protein